MQQAQVRIENIIDRLPEDVLWVTLKV
jgi:hypothetical protein